MADNLTDSEENRLLDLSLPSGSVYLALFTVAPDDAGAGGTEVSGGAYARQSITAAAASAGAKSNNADILFPVASAAWGTIVAYGVFDAASAGTMRWHRTLTAGEQRSINTNDQYKVTSGTLQFTMT